MGNEIPSIVISTNGCNDRILREIKAGIEEEGIPYKVYVDSKEFYKTPYNTALISKFGIGANANKNNLTLYYSKMPDKKPVFDISIGDSDYQVARNFGTNAARLYKGLPFKLLQKTKNDTADKKKDNTDILENIVKEIVEKYISSR
ncbi:glycerol dehydratase reactivase beta/small subunit family protein [Thermoanaerobacterium sp. RBIITD]|uniref:glycerol dehydratase reactivase beta/small subunit family protein n=1 Tax=Thermoanaerobacterium sp. RBIITD TaxID=1550240 RepID=UPI000BC0D339|nr:glycerol dehydratase reactivase beta/small subunit family protein [Thermoanaerobacterium sp. RBIITD]SNX54721.1 Dehydratase medium subunit [Thermoanaerobacterium sp. RBIITD]